MTPSIGRVLILAKQNLFILFNFVFIGPQIGCCAIVPLLILYGTAEKAMKGPVSLLELAVLPLTFLFALAAGIPYAYWLGFVPAFIAGGVVCAVHTAGFRISWPVQIAAATAAFLPEILRGAPHVALANVLFLGIPCLVATVVCCRLLLRWADLSGLQP